MLETVVINEIYLSIQGESTWAGLPCVFIRTAGCPLRCSYCDTAYAFGEGKRLSVSEIVGEVERLAKPYAKGVTAAQPLPLVELTGGEPLLQPQTIPLMRALCDAGFTVLLETSGAMDISSVDRRVHKIMDLKCPSSGEEGRNRWQNLASILPTDEIKFVIATWEDYAWSKEQVAIHGLNRRCPVLFSWASPLSLEQQDPTLKPLPDDHHPLTRRELVEQLLADRVPVRFQLQMHKFIWEPQTRGV